MAPWVEGFLVCLCLFAGCRKSREVNSCCRVLIALISELCFVHGHGKGGRAVFVWYSENNCCLS